MYQILIVDDEKIIRMGMKKAIDWEAAGVDRVFTAGSAKEALEILEVQEIQILITDIQMSHISGLELIEDVKEKYPAMKIIVLTGFDEFDYAHKCLKMKVDDFLLKPADEDYLAGIVKRQVDELTEAKRQKKLAVVTRRVIGNREQLQLNRMMSSLLKNPENAPGTAQSLCEKYGYSPGQVMQAAVFLPRVYGFEEQEEESYLFLSVRDFCNKNIDLQEKGITFLDDQERIVAAWFLNEINEDISLEIEDLIRLLKDEFGISQKIVLGSVVTGFGQLRISYHDAIFLMESGQQSYRDLIQDRQRLNKNQMFWEVFGEIKNAVSANQGNAASVMRAFSAFCQMTESYHLSGEHVKRCCFELAAAVYYTHIANHGEAKENTISSFTNAIQSAKSGDALEITRAFIEGMHHTEEENIHSLVEQARDYIRNHLSEELSVTGIAQMLFLTPSYFSRLFKKVSHEGCNDYIVRLRMEKAQYLLESTNMKTGEIALIVGYPNKNYFSLAFKKHSGLSPTSYRERVRENPEAPLAKGPGKGVESRRLPK